MQPKTRRALLSSTLNGTATKVEYTQSYVCTSFNLLPGHSHLQSICPLLQHTESPAAGEGLQDQLPPPTAPQVADTLQHNENPAEEYNSIKLKFHPIPEQSSRLTYTINKMLQAVCRRGKPQRFPASSLQTQAILLAQQLLLHRLHLLS